MAAITDKWIDEDAGPTTSFYARYNQTDKE
jgi:hypothetical protein